MILVFLSILLAYLVGSIPTAYIFGRILKGIDIRDYGSGNVGATNVFRTVGKTPGIIVLVIDFLKGFLVVTVIPVGLKAVAPDLLMPAYALILMGAAVIAGHIWTVFLGFKGGKGVATTAGVVAGLSPLIFAGCLVIWAVVFAIWKYVSLASIVAATSLPAFAVISGKDLTFVIFCAVLCFVGIYGHRDNIKRLIRGKEKKIL
ncbi:MAG: glycerol-3-phosphate 1-O-acyltransferase PlsY [Candidatus Omnitrophota bacterium]